MKHEFKRFLLQVFFNYQVPVEIIDNMVDLFETDEERKQIMKFSKIDVEFAFAPILNALIQAAVIRSHHVENRLNYMINLESAPRYDIQELRLKLEKKGMLQ
jgi:hypothetical protein